MYLSKRVKVVAGVSALLGLVMAGGAAFTGAGLSDSAGVAQFVGGTIVQNAVGTDLSSVVYGYANPTPDPGYPSDTEVNLVTLNFADANSVGYLPTISFTGDDSSPVDDEYTAWTCLDIAGTPDGGPFTGGTSTCSPSGSLASGQDYANLVNSITVTVPPLSPSETTTTAA